ncbi:MAG: transposase [Candidatus Thiodiazotropha endolucinida]
MPNKITSKQGKEAFLECLKEAHARFGMDVHAYYLMENHYHLLISTPRGNLK